MSRNCNDNLYFSEEQEYSEFCLQKWKLFWPSSQWSHVVTTRDTPFQDHDGNVPFCNIHSGHLGIHCHFQVKRGFRMDIQFATILSNNGFLFRFVRNHLHNMSGLSSQIKLNRKHRNKVSFKYNLVNLLLQFTATLMVHFWHQHTAKLGREL